jgi:hypothetical protein
MRSLIWMVISLIHGSPGSLGLLIWVLLLIYSVVLLVCGRRLGTAWTLRASMVLVFQAAGFVESMMWA